jgi:inorganic triphosphatase YgiF
MLELEAKFDVSDPVELEAIAGLDRIGDFELDDPMVLKFDDAYYDTSTLDMLQVGCYLRLRRQVNRSTLTFKQLLPGQGDLHTEREEVSEDLSPEALAAFFRGEFDCEPLTLAIRAAAGREVTAVVNVTNRRTAIVAVRGAAELELALDDLEFRGPRGKARSWEVEVELLTGSSTDLEDLAALLAARPGLQPSFRSKFERAIEAVG